MGNDKKGISRLTDPVLDLVIQSFVSHVWERPELSRIRDPLANLLQTSKFKTLTRKAWDEFQKSSENNTSPDNNLPGFFDETFVRHPVTQRHLYSFIFYQDQTALEELAKTYAEFESIGDSTSIRDLLNAYGVKLRQVFLADDDFRAMVMSQDINTLITMMQLLVTNSNMQDQKLDEMREQLATILDAQETELRTPHIEEVHLPEITLQSIPQSRQTVGVTVFVSYAHVDFAAVAPIVKRLERASYNVWIDRASIRGGSNWQQSIAAAIKTCDQFMFFLSPYSITSPWCRAELRYALDAGNIPIIPVRISGDCDAAGFEAIDDRLTAMHYRDFVESDYEAAWRDLLNDLPPVLARDRWLLDVDAQRRHRRYLRQFFKKDFFEVNLGDIVDDPVREHVPLTKIYVPLPVDMSITVKVNPDDKCTIDDWWVQVERSETKADDAVPEAMREQRLHEWIQLKVGADGIEVLLDDVRHKLEQGASDLTDYQFRSEQNWYMEAHDAALIQPYMVLTGRPGSGKSTFLKHLAICLAGEWLERDPDELANLKALRFWNLPLYTPVFIRMRDLVNDQFPDPTAEAGTAQFENYLQAILKKYNNGAYWEDLQRQMDEDGDVIILLDGLDEVPDAQTDERRKQIQQLVDELKVNYEDCRIIITSRPEAYHGDWSLDDFGTTALIPLHYGRVQELAYALFSQILDSEKHNIRDEAQGFIDQLQKLDDVELTNIPLLFTMMATLWLSKIDTPMADRLPSGKAELYQASLNLMLIKWTQQRDGQEAVAKQFDLSPDELWQTLEITAYHVHKAFREQGASLFKSSVFVDAAEEVKNSHFPDYADALESLEQHAGVLVSDAPLRYRFAHLSFQEYLTASYLTQDQAALAEIGIYIRTEVGRWKNVLELLIDLYGMDEAKLRHLFNILTDAVSQASQIKVAEAEMIGYAITLEQHGITDLAADRRKALARSAEKVLEKGLLPPIDRARVGRYVAKQGDTRPGVGVDEDGNPDIEWVPITGGRYTFQNGEGTSLEEEITIEAFEVSKYPVTNGQFNVFIEVCRREPNGSWWDGIPVDKRRFEDPRWSESNHPRENVSWYQAVAYCRWMNTLPGFEGVRLADEREWEYVATNGATQTTYPYGNKFDSSKANVSATDIDRTSAVGIFPDGASDDGVADLSGNVWEWCLNKYDDIEMMEVDTGDARRVVRGGSWLDVRGLSRAVYGLLPTDRDYGVGFRLVRPPSQSFC